MNPESLRALEQLLWSSPDDRVYALVDGASVPSLLDRLYGLRRPRFECLITGDLEPDMAEVAPYLVELEQGGEFADWLLTQGWGNHWGCYAIASADLRSTWFYLRSLVIAYGPDGNPVLFRYYDPRVMRVFLPTCTPDQVKEMFGRVKSFIVEADEPGQALVFTHTEGVLSTGIRKVVHA